MKKLNLLFILSLIMLVACGSDDETEEINNQASFDEFISSPQNPYRLYAQNASGNINNNPYTNPYANPFGNPNNNGAQGINIAIYNDGTYDMNSGQNNNYGNPYYNSGNPNQNGTNRGNWNVTGSILMLNGFGEATRVNANGRSCLRINPYNSSVIPPNTVFCL